MNVFEIYGNKNKKNDKNGRSGTEKDNEKNSLAAKKNDEKDQLKIIKDVDLMKAVKNKEIEKIVALIGDGANPTKTYLEYL